MFIADGIVLYCKYVKKSAVFKEDSIKLPTIHVQQLV